MKKSKYSEVYTAAKNAGFTSGYVRENNFKLSLDLFKQRNGLCRKSYKIIDYSCKDLIERIEAINEPPEENKNERIL